MKLPTRLISSILRVATALLLGAASVAAYAQAANSIEAINVSPQAGGKVVIKVTMKQAPASPPAGFTINNPPRIAFDFPNTGSTLGRGTQEVGEGDLRSYNVVQAGDRTRLVLNLTRVSSYDTQIDGRALLITLQSSAAAASPAGATTTFAQVQPGDQRHALRNIDFRRGRSGEGRVVVDLSDSAVGINLRLQGKAIVIDFINTTLPKNLERRMDVTDFGTPVQFISAFTQGGNSRVTIEPTGTWEHTAYQTDNRFTVEIKQQIEDSDRIARGTGFKGEKLSLNFQNVEVRAVLQVIADFTGLNVITTDTVTGNLTLRLKDVPWDQALDLILQSKGLDMRKTGNVVWIAPRDELALREKTLLETRHQTTDIEPLQTQSFQLNYQQASAWLPVLKDKDNPILSKRGSIIIDPRTNTLFVQDVPARVEAIRELIRKVDVPQRQVMIEARIVEANDDFARNLGVRLGINEAGIGHRVLGGRVGDARAHIGGGLFNSGFQTNQVKVPPDPNFLTTDTLNVALPAPSIGTSTAGVFSLILFNQNRTRFLNMELSALQVDGRGKIISSPRVVTADKAEATIEDGVEIPYLTASSSGSTSISFRKATLSLKVKPQVTPDDNVIMNLKVNKDSRGEDTIAGPAINTKQIVTEVLVENGGTVVIGGIYVQEETSQTRKIPVLGDLPYVGFLFKQNLKLDNRRELLIFITPKILKDSVTLRD